MSSQEIRIETIPEPVVQQDARMIAPLALGDSCIEMQLR
jgi:hypothetical protein